MARTRKNEPVISLVFGDALREAREAEHLSHEELAKRIDKSVGLLSMYETGQKFPPLTTLEALEREVKKSLRKEWEEVKPEWERYVANLKEQREAETPKSDKLTSRPYATIKIEGYIAAGQPIENFWDSDETLTVPVEMLYRPKLPAFGLRVRGDSMIDEFIADGDVIVLQNYSPPRNGMTVAALIRGKEAVCKRWYRQGGKVRLLSANPAYPEPMVYPQNEVEFKGVVVGLIRMTPLRPPVEREIPDQIIPGEPVSTSLAEALQRQKRQKTQTRKK